MRMDLNKLFDAKSIKINDDMFEFDTILEYEQILLVISKAIVQYRKKQGITQKQLSEILDMKQSMISKLERGTYNPTFKMLYNISRQLTKSSDLFIKILKDIIRKLYNNQEISHTIRYTNNEFYETYKFKEGNNITYLVKEYNKEDFNGGFFYGEECTSQFPIAR